VLRGAAPEAIATAATPARAVAAGTLGRPIPDVGRGTTNPAAECRLRVRCSRIKASCNPPSPFAPGYRSRVRAAPNRPGDRPGRHRRPGEFHWTGAAPTTCSSYRAVIKAPGGAITTWSRSRGTVRRGTNGVPLMTCRNRAQRPRTIGGTPVAATYRPYRSR